MLLLNAFSSFPFYPLTPMLLFPMEAWGFLKELFFKARINRTRTQVFGSSTQGAWLDMNNSIDLWKQHCSIVVAEQVVH